VRKRGREEGGGRKGGGREGGQERELGVTICNEICLH
jgi:hypothetical protein